MAKALKANYQKNIDILKENLRRGLSQATALKQIKIWQSQFIEHDLYGEDEKAFINEALRCLDLPLNVTMN